MKTSTAPVCGETYIDEEKVKRALKLVPSTNVLTNLAESFKILGDTTRLKILIALSEEELCVCDLSALIKVSVSAISHQLRLLRNLRFVKFRKEGKMVYYSLSDDHIKTLIEVAITHEME
jgi:DNA-binding transcriptional ArsR family regulator